MRFELRDLNDETFEIVKNALGDEERIIRNIKYIYTKKTEVWRAAISEDHRSFLMMEPILVRRGNIGFAFLFVSDGVVVHVTTESWYGRRMKLFFDSQKNSKEVSKVLQDLPAAFSVHGPLGDGKDVEHYHPEVVSIKFGSEEWKNAY